MSQIGFAPQARSDLIDIFNYIAADDAEQARQFVEELETRCRHLLDFPHAGRAREELAPNLRSKPHGRYVIFYTSGAETVRIERILHGARDVEGELRGGS